MTQANYTNISFNSNNFFSGYVSNNDIYTINGELIGVNLAKFQEVEQGLLTCKNRLIELGEIKVPKTQEEIIKEQSEMLEKQQIVINQMLVTCQQLQERINNEYTTTDGANKLFASTNEEQSNASTRESTSNDRPVENKNTSGCNASSGKSKK